MSKINMELLKHEFSTWSKLKKKEVIATPNFGKFISAKFNIVDRVLEEEVDHNWALLYLIREYAQGEKS
jgi:hypothetical protein